MKKRTAIGVLMCVIMLMGFAFAPQLATEVDAAVTKTAALKDLKISFYGQEPVIMQGYNIDGSNFVRVKEFTDLGDMDSLIVYSAVNSDRYQTVFPGTKAKQPSTFAKLTEKTLSVAMEQHKLSISGLSEKVDCFTYKGDYFFKLSDMARISKGSVDKAIEVSKTGNAHSGRGVLVFLFEANWNNETQTIEVDRTAIDLYGIYTDAQAGKPFDMKNYETKDLIQRENYSPGSLIGDFKKLR